MDVVKKFLLEGKVIAYPTDTVYGLGCRADSAEAVRRVYRIKRRKSYKPLIILASSMAMAKKYVMISRRQEEYLSRYWPGPVTVIFESKGRLPKEVEGGTGSLAFRVPDNDFLIKLINSIRSPLVSTSLNISGQEPVRDPGLVKQYFGKICPDLIVDAGMLKRRKASKLIDLRDIDSVKIVRK